MNPDNAADQNAFRRATGFALLTRSPDWIPLREQMLDLVRSRLAKVPWIPADVVGRLVGAPQTAPNGGIYLPFPIPTVTIAGTVTPTNPAWLDTVEKKMWWDEFVAALRDANDAFDRKQWSQGQAVMRSAQMNAALWDAAYRIAKFFATPVEWGEKAADNFFKSTTFKLLLVGGIAYAAIQMGAFRPRAARTNPGRRRRRR